MDTLSPLVWPYIPNRNWVDFCARTFEKLFADVFDSIGGPLSGLPYPISNLPNGHKGAQSVSWQGGNFLQPLSCKNVYSSRTRQHRDVNNHTLLLWCLAPPASCTAALWDTFGDSAFNVVVTFFIPSIDTSSRGHIVYMALRMCKQACGKWRR